MDVYSKFKILIRWRIYIYTAKIFNYVPACSTLGPFVVKNGKGLSGERKVECDDVYTHVIYLWDVFCPVWLGSSEISAKRHSFCHINARSHLTGMICPIYKELCGSSERKNMHQLLKTVHILSLVKLVYLWVTLTCLSEHAHVYMCIYIKYLLAKRNFMPSVLLVF